MVVARDNTDHRGSLDFFHRFEKVLARLHNQSLGVIDTIVKAAAFQQFGEAFFVFECLIEGVCIFELIGAEDQRVGDLLIDIQSAVAAQMEIDPPFNIWSIWRTIGCFEAPAGTKQRQEQRDQNHGHAIRGMSLHLQTFTANGRSGPSPLIQVRSETPRFSLQRVFLASIICVRKKFAFNAPQPVFQSRINFILRHDDSRTKTTTAIHVLKKRLQVLRLNK